MHITPPRTKCCWCCDSGSILNANCLRLYINGLTWDVLDTVSGPIAPRLPTQCLTKSSLSRTRGAALLPCGEFPQADDHSRINCMENLSTPPVHMPVVHATLRYGGSCPTCNWLSRKRPFTASGDAEEQPISCHPHIAFSTTPLLLRRLELGTGQLGHSSLVGPE